MSYTGKIRKTGSNTPTDTSASGIWNLNEVKSALEDNTWPASIPGRYGLRFSRVNAPSLLWKPNIAGNQRKWTWSAWVKFVDAEAPVALFSAGTGGSTRSYIYTGGGKFLQWANSALGTSQSLNMAMRDTLNWYHIMVVWDTAQATDSNRSKIYVNGVLQTDLDGDPIYPSQNAESYIGSTDQHEISRQSSLGSRWHEGYMSEINFVDGIALAPSDFGYTDNNGVWQPKFYDGAYGTNGFRLDFSDHSSVTALGYDKSGNNNHFTPVGLSLEDVVTDAPASYGTDNGLGGEVSGTYATWNDLFRDDETENSKGLLKIRATANNGGGESTLYLPTSGKYYFEVFCEYVDVSTTLYISVNPQDGGQAQYRAYGQIWYDGNTGTGYEVVRTGDTLGVACDVDNNTVTFYHNGKLQRVVENMEDMRHARINAYLARGAASYPPGDTWVANFGQKPFNYPAPEGYKTLCLTNFPEPTIDATEHFAAIEYTGDEVDNRSIDVGFPPDLVWIKVRNQTYAHYWFDSVRGAGKRLITSSANAESDNATSNDEVQAFEANGFQIGANIGVNDTGESIIAWCWKAGGTAVINSEGSVNAQVSANVDAGFSIATYTGAGGQTFGHGLNKAPEVVLIKNRTSGYNWYMYVEGVTAANQSLDWNTQNVVGTPSTSPNWSVTDTLVGNANQLNVGTNGDNYVAYCWHSVPGFSQFGVYEGFASDNGGWVNCGFQPAFVMIRALENQADSIIFDTTRDVTNPARKLIYSNLTTVEQDGVDVREPDAIIDINSNGFKVRSSNNDLGADGENFFYMAFAGKPTKYTRGR